MSPEHWRQIEKVYHQALERSLDERPAFLDQACGGDAALRHEVESLLAQDASGDGFLVRPVWEDPGSLLNPTRTQLHSGSLLGPYCIENKIGEGGMGAVYRAHDSRLGRDVAIKVAASQFSGRFEREARAVAALNHPNICTLHDVGPNFLVMELVEGETLAARLKRGKLSIDDTLRYGAQIADALAAAHAKGIVHRDLKPGNIMVTKSGVKVLDFGLAKSRGAETMTGTNVIMGTPAYMAPEQREGRDAGPRTDLYALGLVLYEMATGKRPSVKPDEKAELGALPGPLGHIVERCLVEDPEARWQSAEEIKALLDWFAVAPKPSVTLPARRWMWRAGAAVFALGALALGYVAYRHSTEEPPRVGRFSLLLPEKLNTNRPGSLPAISPDGRRVAFTAFSGDDRVTLLGGGRGALWLRDLDGLNARMLPGTAGAVYPFWSPDSRSLGFFTENQLNRIEVADGPAQKVCDVEGIGRGGTWSQDNIIVYGTGSGGIRLVPAAGGTLVALTAPDAAAGESNHRTPWFLPDGQHFLYTARSSDAAKTRVYVDSIDAKPRSRTRREVLAADSNAVYVPPVHSTPGFSKTGYLLFVRDHTLLTQPFDPANAQTTGAAVPLAEQVDYFSSTSQAQFSASRDGTLVYVSGGASRGNKQLTWFDRSGKSRGTVGMPANTLSVSLSPDGVTVAADPLDTANKSEVWLHDLARGTALRFTFTGTNISPIWSPDGTRIAFSSNRDGGIDPYVKPANGTGVEQAVDQNLRYNWITDWSRDGRYLIEVVDDDQKTSFDIWIIPQFGDRKPFPYVNSRYAERNAKLSPSGQWLAYVSNETTRNEIYVQTFPEHGGKWQISTNGGDFPVWSRDGRELYFIGADRKLMAVEVKVSGKSFQAGVPKPLFEVAAQGQFDVSKDGRFLIQVPVEQGSANVPLTVVTNWQAGLKK
ncbi:MAG: protein kinase [Acidobacteriota bacterium]